MDQTIRQAEHEGNKSRIIQARVRMGLCPQCGVNGLNCTPSFPAFCCCFECAKTLPTCWCNTNQYAHCVGCPSPHVDCAFYRRGLMEQI